ncbi:MAG: Unknown protein [uncultured Thiotrichaceae bacterium]|uniref:DUF1449 domain-containing protein n=1 Tax=uncultured Thiotrichaceae bacterium TaxID=298394 RepID=A0A6S6SKV6_9GAMM|nr:MAG: Unknown protein [uncultured Thiotrichaceae bacterium]
MGEFIQQVFVFPTVFFSALLTFVVLYWLTTVLGVLGVDSLDSDWETDAEPAGIGGWLIKFKLDGIPLTISLSFIILVSWVFSFLAVHFIYPVLPAGWVQIAVDFWLLLLIPIVAAAIVSPFLQPLKPLFKKTKEVTFEDRIGMRVAIRTGYVNETFGEAELADGGAGLILKVRASEPNTFKRGDTSILRAYDETTNTYRLN